MFEILLITVAVANLSRMLLKTFYSGECNSDKNGMETLFQVLGYHSEQTGNAYNLNAFNEAFIRLAKPN